MRSLLLAVTFGAALIGCRSSTKSDNGTAPIYPARKGSAGDATVQTKIAPTLKPADGDRVVVDLERIPTPNTGALWACYDVPAPDFSIGRLVCADGSGKTVALSGAHVQFTCRNNPDFKPVAPALQPNLSGCDAYEVWVDAFAPALDVSVTR